MCLGTAHCPFALSLWEVSDLPVYRVKFDYHIHPGSGGERKSVPTFTSTPPGPQQHLEGESSAIPGAGIPKS